jgi:hypothetical protein
VIASITIACSSIGWWLGNLVGFFTAFILSTIGTGIGVYVGKRLVDI